MADQPPWAGEVADIIEPGAWAVLPYGLGWVVTVNNHTSVGVGNGIVSIISPTTRSIQSAQAGHEARTIRALLAGLRAVEAAMETP